MLVLFETAAGYAVFKAKNEKKLQKVENLFDEFQKPEVANKLLQLVKFEKFKHSVEALEAGTATIEGKLSKPLKKLLKKLFVDEVQEELAVADTKLAVSIKEKFNVNCLANSSIQELMRCIRSQTQSLLSDTTKKEMSTWELSLAHSLSRYKLKFSPDKVDTMIVQAIKILDELDKKINNNVMTVKQWYGWHFPEMEKDISDNITLIRTIQELGFRTNAETADLSKVLPDGLDAKVKREAEISIGTDITPDDLEQIMNMCDEVIMWTDARAELYDYLKNRMAVIAPNLTLLVGELVGARLIAHAGSMLNFAKHPASTIQILGAEKALFRALKTKHDTPKYGIIYHASLVGQCNPKYKGKISRMLAAKVALAVRYDALADDDTQGTDMAIEARAKLERMLISLDEDKKQKLTGSGKKRPQFDKYENKSVVMNYPMQSDSTLPKKRKAEDSLEQPTKKMKTEQVESNKSAPNTPVDKSAKKKKRESAGAALETPAKTEVEQTEEKSEKKKKKRKSEGVVVSESPGKTEDAVAEVVPTSAGKSDKKKKKKKHSSGEVAAETSVMSVEESAEVPKKKKRKHESGNAETPVKAPEEPSETGDSQKRKK